MSQAITLLSLVPIRKSPSEQSEMVSQLLFGETCIILNEEGDWLNIKTTFDDYCGWIDKKMVTEIDSDFSKIGIKQIIANPFIKITNNEDNTSQYIVAGSEIYNLSKQTKTFSINSKSYILDDLHEPDVHLSIRDQLINTAMSFINSPYLWGGRSIFGIDCSGLVQIVYKVCKINLPRDAKDQNNTGETISIDKSKHGDLAFFTKDGRTISHVGIILKDDKIIHASGKVRIDKLDQSGILNEDLNDYSHQLVSIKNLL